MAAFTATPFRGHGLSSVAVTTTFGATHRLSSIVESRYARDYIPEFQAKFRVHEEEANGPNVGPPTDPMSIPIPLKYPTPDAFPMGVSLKQEKPPRLRGLLAQIAFLGI